MADRTVRMTIEFDVSEAALRNLGLQAEDVYRNILLREEDAGEGFRITAEIPNKDRGDGPLLLNPRVTAQALSPVKAVEHKTLKELIREKIRQQGVDATGISERERRALIHHNESISLLADEAMRYLSDARVSAEDAVECAFARALPGVLENFRDEFTVSVVRAGEHDFQDIRLYDLEEGDLVLDCSGYIHSVATEGVPERDYVVGADYMYLGTDNLASGMTGSVYEVPCTISAGEHPNYQGTAYFNPETGDVYNLTCSGLQRGQVYALLDAGEGRLAYNGVHVPFEQDHQGRHAVAQATLQALGLGKKVSRLEARIDAAIERQNGMRADAGELGKDTGR